MRFKIAISIFFVVVVAFFSSLIYLLSSDSNHPEARLAATHAHTGMQLTIIETIDEVQNGMRGQRLVVHGEDNNSVVIVTCDVWPVIAGKKYQIDTYRIWIEGLNTWGTCYHQSNIHILQ